ELRDRALLSRGESIDGLRRGQGLPYLRVGRGDIRIRGRHASDPGERRIDLIERTHTQSRRIVTGRQCYHRRWRDVRRHVVRVRPDLLESQEELVRSGPLLQRNHRADGREELAGGRRVPGRIDRRIERDVRLANASFGTVYADAYALDRKARGRGVRVETDER